MFFVGCDARFGGFGALIGGLVIVCDMFGFWLIVLFLYNVISFGVLVIFFCLLLIDLGCLFSFVGVLGLFVICLDVGRLGFV